MAAAGDINSNNKKFPLTLRKQFRENEAKLKEHLTAIQKALGFAVTYEANGEAFYDAVEDRREQLGGILYDDYPAAIRGCLEEWAKESKENATELKTAMTTKKIVLRLVPQKDEKHKFSYIQMLLEKGTLVVQVTKDTFYCNMSELNIENLLEAFKSVVDEKAECKAPEKCAAFPLHIRKHFAKYTKVLEESLAKIKKATGAPFTFNADYKNIRKAVTDDDYKERLGEIIWEGILTRVATAIEELCADSMSKEAFLEAVSKRAIEYRLISEDPAGAKVAGSYQKMYIDGGKLIVGASPSNIYTNIDEISKSNLESLL